MKDRLIISRQMVQSMLPEPPQERLDRLRCKVWALTRQREEIVVKRRLSTAMILAIVLTLLAAGALAAVLLGGKDFVEQIMAPKAVETDEGMWSKEDIDEIQRLAQEKGLTLSEDLRQRLQYTDKEYKEELMRAFAKEELGFYPSTWSIEDQHWYNQLLVDSGLSEAQEHALIEAGEMNQEEALSRAQAYMRDKWGADPAQLEDSGKYIRHLQYLLYKESQYSQGKQWMIEYAPKLPELDTYGLTLLTDGRVKDDYYRPGIGKEDTRVMEVFDAYRDTHGNMWHWDMPTWIACRQDMLKAAALTGEGDSPSLRAIMQQDYVLPEEGMISPEQAIATGLQAADQAAYDYSPKPLHSAVLLADGDQRLRKVRVQGVGGELLKYEEVEHLVVEIDAYTRQVIKVQRYKNGEYGWGSDYVLARLAPKVVKRPQLPEPLAQKPSPRPDGKPGLWYSDLAPAYYWEALDQVGYTGQTGSDLMSEWTRRYGQDKGFWPLEAQAIDHLWHDIQYGDVLYGLPGPDDMRQDEALEMAREAVLEDKALDLSREDLDKLVPQYVFRFNAVERGSHTWDVIFCDVSGPIASPVVNVSIDSLTREIIDISDGRLSNG